MKTLVPVPTPASGFVTVTSRAPVVAPPVIEMFTLRWEESTNVVVLTVIPVPENVAAAPLTKLVPTTEIT